MKNYDAYNGGIFPVKFDEIKNLIKDNKMCMKSYDKNLARVKEYLMMDVTEFTLKVIPKNLKRSRYDSACLLVFRTSTGDYFAKRHNNSQHLNIEY